ncbi:hypothetical protein TRFO_15826 [Tritrichomonas foetus]|uniref:Uncharacterized protein n=1 Tax=Tritrichomonas foetus TaxID=1144522 RepID=A0A1J4KS55_9EUKA|nr:hypothetical protein TRFO_15826 [Tritrichomonas foetus]|eukprot:OHT13930.1 hypothetical protein TRFO_15826 [Tritrichomonas foetus]
METLVTLQNELLELSVNNIDEFLGFCTGFIEENTLEIFFRLFLSICRFRHEKIEFYCNFLILLKKHTNIPSFQSILTKLLNEQIHKYHHYFTAIYLCNKNFIKSEEIQSYQNLVSLKSDTIYVDGKKQKINSKFHQNQINLGVTPSLFVKYLREDDVKSFIQISNNNLDFITNFEIETSQYERCEMINTGVTKLIEAAVYFSAIKCLKYMINIGIPFTEKLTSFIIASNDSEIIHLCEDNGFELDYLDAMHTAIRYHNNDVFEWIYDKIKPIPTNDRLENLERCLKNNNYDLFQKHFQNQIGCPVLKEQIKFGNFLIIKYCLKNCTNIHLLSQLFIYACNENQQSCLKFILDKIPSKLNKYDKLRFPYFDIILNSWLNDKLELARFLLNYEKIDINEKYIFEFRKKFPNLKLANQPTSLLLLACDSNLESLIDEILNINSININECCNDADFNQRNIIDSICENCSLYILERIYSKFRNKMEKLELNLPLHYACRGNKLNNAKYIIEKFQFDVNKVDTIKGRSIFHFACEINNLEFLQYFLSLSEVRFPCYDTDGNSPFLYAAKFNSINCFEFLLNKKDLNININEYDRQNHDNIIHIACKLSSIEILKLLICHPDLNVNAQNDDIILGFSPSSVFYS